MSYSIGRPAIPCRPLSYWLETDAARMAPENTPSALRDMAWAYGQWRGLAAAATGLGLALLGGGILALVMMVGYLGLWLSLLLTGTALVITGALVFRLKLPQIATARRPGFSRSPGKFSSGVSLALFMALALGGITGFAISPWLAQGPGPTISFVVVCFLILLGAASAFAVPSYFEENARRDFRKYIDEHPVLRTELEKLSLIWQDPAGDRQFGPL